MRAALDRAGGDAEQRGDLGDRAVLDVHEAQHVSFRAGQRGAAISARASGGLGRVGARGQRALLERAR